MKIQSKDRHRAKEGEFPELPVDMVLDVACDASNRDRLSAGLDKRLPRLSKSGFGLMNVWIGKGSFIHFFSYPFWKSAFDRVLAVVALIVLFPLLSVLAFAIRIDSQGNPIFTQERVGKSGRRFTIYKFRTMQVNNDESEFQEWATANIMGGKQFSLEHQDDDVYRKLQNDPRVTSVGSWLRKTNIDELPQLINIVKGDMSFVGPRPETVFQVELYDDWHLERLSVMPGITGLWQVTLRRSNVRFNEMARLDIEYARQQSLILDVKIMLRTAVVLLGRDGS